MLFVDNNLIIVNKRHNVSVIPGRGDSGIPSLREQIEKEIGQKIFVVHRIDRATSGTTIFARNSEMHRILCKQFEMRKVKKEYLAVVLGKMSGEGTIDRPIKQFGSGRMGIHENGKPSETRYQVVEQYEMASLVKVFPFTGRRHQIRVHLYDAGYPVLGDPLYGKGRPVGGVERLMLHAQSVSFSYPENREFSISAPTGTVWNEILDRLKVAGEADVDRLPLSAINN